jgi:hypothetical protein
MSETCKSCRFWVQTRTIDSEFSMGECRRHPPTVFYDPTSDDNPVFAEWPPVSSSEWCGDYE